MTASPYSCGWNSGNYANGNHAVSATARDSAGNASTASVTVNVSNGSDVTPPNRFDHVALAGNDGLR